MVKNIPNILTIIRIICSLIIPILLKLDKINILIIVLFISVISDFLDGFIARNWSLTSTTGKILDVIADKSLGIIVAIVFTSYISKLFLINVLGEIIISIVMVSFYIRDGILKTWDFSKYKSSIYGKTKTTIIFFTLFVSFLSYKYNIYFDYIIYLIILTFISQIITALNYYKQYKKQ